MLSASIVNGAVGELIASSNPKEDSSGCLDRNRCIIRRQPLGSLRPPAQLPPQSSQV